MPLSYAEVTAITYVSEDMAVLLSPEQQSLAVQAMALFQGPEQWTDYDTYSDDIDADVAATIFALINQEIPPPVLGAMSEANCWPNEAFALSGASVVANVTTGQFHNLVGQQSPNANNNLLVWKRYLAAGDWSFSYLYQRNTNSGIIDIYVREPDTTDVILAGGVDLRGTLLANQFVRGTFTLDQSGLMEIRTQVIGTSGAPTAFAVPFTLLQLWRTGP